MNDKQLIDSLADALSKRLVYPPPTERELELLVEAEKRIFSEKPLEERLEEMAANWGMRPMKMRIDPPHNDYDDCPTRCDRCRKEYPGFFRVPEEVWEYYVIPSLRREVICLACYNALVEEKDNGLFQNAYPGYGKPIGIPGGFLIPEGMTPEQFDRLPVGEMGLLGERPYLCKEDFLRLPYRSALVEAWMAKECSSPI